MAAPPEDSILLEPVVNDHLQLSIDPTRKQQTEERERRRQRIHVVSVPERLSGFKDWISWDVDWADVLRHKPSS